MAGHAYDQPPARPQDARHLSDCRTVVEEMLDYFETDQRVNRARGEGQSFRHPAQKLHSALTRDLS
jgi:hypothetical protein